MADRLTVAEGLKIFSIRATPEVEDPREYSMTVNLCVTNTNVVDDLRQTATVVASWLKKNPISISVVKITEPFSSCRHGFTLVVLEYADRLHQAGGLVRAA
ncbi:hypothetical protein ACFWU5_28285, partial [Nocardia sp. NPDC058640]|uniref:hypothetical protein n=1 Tax=Nocardia sp. NPDC058640 TaxID=3346571 RepID=UPI0036666F08